MSLTQEELQKLFPAYFETTNDSIVVDECPEGFEKDQASGECVEIQTEISDGPQPFEMPENAGTPLTVSADVDVVKEEIEKVKPFQPDVDFIKAITEGNKKLIDFQNTYEDGSLDPTTLDKVDEFYELKFGPLIGDVNIPNPFAKEVLSDQNLKDQDIRKLLGQIGLEGPAHVMPINDLSGGQKARVMLTAIFLQKPHILLLDEPTNHLDIESIIGLIEGINNFDGGVGVISHDA